MAYRCESLLQHSSSPGHGDVSHPCVDNWYCAGAMLSLLLINLLVDSLSAARTSASPPNCTPTTWSSWRSSPRRHPLETAMAILFREWTNEICRHDCSGPPRHALTYIVCFPRDLMVTLGAVLTPLLQPPISTTWCAVSLSRTERCPVPVARFLLPACVVRPLSVPNWEVTVRSLARFDLALCWPRGTPNASVLCEPSLHDGLRVSSGPTLARRRRVASCPLGAQPSIRLAPSLQSQPPSSPSFNCCCWHHAHPPTPFYDCECGNYCVWQHSAAVGTSLRPISARGPLTKRHTSNCTMKSRKQGVAGGLSPADTTELHAAGALTFQCWNDRPSCASAQLNHTLDPDRQLDPTSWHMGAVAFPSHLPSLRRPP